MPIKMKKKEAILRKRVRTNGVIKHNAWTDEAREASAEARKTGAADVTPGKTSLLETKNALLETLKVVRAGNTFMNKAHQHTSQVVSLMELKNPPKEVRAGIRQFHEKAVELYTKAAEIYKAADPRKASDALHMANWHTERLNPAGPKVKRNAWTDEAREASAEARKKRGMDKTPGGMTLKEKADAYRKASQSTKQGKPDAFAVGDKVQFVDPDPLEAEDVFKVVEDRGDRVLVQDMSSYWDDKAIRPTNVIAKADLIKHEVQPDAPGKSTAPDPRGSDDMGTDTGYRPQYNIPQDIQEYGIKAGMELTSTGGNVDYMTMTKDGRDYVLSAADDSGSPEDLESPACVTVYKHDEDMSWQEMMPGESKNFKTTEAAINYVKKVSVAKDASPGVAAAKADNAKNVETAKANPSMVQDYYDLHRGNGMSHASAVGEVRTKWSGLSRSDVEGLVKTTIEKVEAKPLTMPKGRKLDLVKSDSAKSKQDAFVDAARALDGAKTPNEQLRLAKAFRKARKERDMRIAKLGQAADRLAVKVRHNTQTPAPGIRHLMSKLVRNSKLDGRDYLVVPTVLIVEGVHNGVLYTNEELQKFPEAWNGRPIVLSHPSINGKPCSAAEPKVLESQTVGTLYNTKYKVNLAGGPGLLSEAWIDVVKCKKNAPKVLKMLQDEEGIEVSTGLFTDDVPPEVITNEDTGEELKANWNGEEYDVIATNYRPDHLALLPGGKGACCWADGAGMPRNNEADEIQASFKENVVKKKDDEDEDVCPDCGESMNECTCDDEDLKDNEEVEVLKANELSFGEIGQRLGDAIRLSVAPKSESSLLPYPSNTSAYVAEVYDKYVIYDHSDYSKTPSVRKQMKQCYEIAADDTVKLIGEPVEVVMKKDYVAVKANKRIASPGGGGVGGRVRANSMKGVNMDRKQKVDALIKSNAVWGEGDRETLESMSDDQFAVVEQGLKANAAPEVKRPATEQEFIASLPEGELRDSVQSGLKIHRDQKTALVAALKANKRNVFTEDALKAKSLDELKALASLAGMEEPEADYSGRSTGIRANAEDDQPGEMPAMSFVKK